MAGSEEDLTDLKCDLQKAEEKFRSVVYVGGESAEVRNGRLTATFDATPCRINDSVYELYRPDPGSGNIDMEVVFFHGLRLGNSYNAHIDTWMSSSEPSECWIKTWLPQLFPRARILTASYDSSGIASGTYSSFDLYLIAEALAQDIIVSAKVGQQFGTPVILVGHCIGGLVIKTLCLHVGQSVSRLDREARKSFVENMTGAFFFATPQSGMKLKHLNDPGPLAESVQVLGKSTARLNESFEDLRKFYGWALNGLGESQPTRLRELQGLFEEEVLMVEEASCRPYLDEFMCIMGADHFSICRPKDMKSSIFDTLVRFFESILVKEKVKHQPPHPQQLPRESVGLEERLFELKKILYERDDVREINICGMGGIGKTTLARALFNELCASDSFDYTTFIESSSYNDYFTLETVIKHHLYCKGMKVSGTRTPINISSKKVLFILDDVRDGYSVNEPVNVWFNEVEKSKYDASSIDVLGSRLIVTSREQDVLRNSRSAHIFDLALLDEKQSYELLVRHAFPNGHSVPDNFSGDLVKTVALKCGGLPLTLEVIGKFLSGRKDPEEWILCLENLDAAGLSDDPIDVRLWKTLKVSYDGINDHLKQMFLDAATIFNGLPLRLAQASWSTTFNTVSSKSPWRHLIGKSLVYGSVEEGDGGIIRMHEQLRSLGRFIAGSEEEKSRRRIWKSEDAWELLTAGSDDDNDSNTDEQLKNIHALRFHFSELDHDTRTDLPIMSPGETETPSVSPNGKVVRISSRPFFKMTKLRYLLLDGVDIVGSDKKKPFSSNLIMLIWSSGGKCSELPIQSNPGIKSQLTVLHLRFVLLESVNSLIIKRFPNLKIVELRSAKRMEKISDKIGNFKHLERLSFFWCPRLEEIPSSIGTWEGLEDLVFWDCPYLHTLPQLAKLSNLKQLILYRCSSLKRLPESIGRLKSLRILDLHRCLNLEELPQSIGNLSSLESLNLSGTFQELPDSFGEHFLALRNLKFKYCENLRSLPPNTFKSCSNLEKLTFLHCHKLQTLAAPEVFDRLKNLKFVLVGWVGVKMDILVELQKFWNFHNINYNVRGDYGPHLALCGWKEDDLDAISVDDDHPLQEEEIEESDTHVTSSNRDCRHEFSGRSPSSSKTCTHRFVKGEGLQHRYLAVESVHESLKRITVEVESHDQGYSSFLWAHGTELSVHSYCELSVRTKLSPEGEELARVILFLNLHAVEEWQTHRCDVDDKELLALVQPGYVVEVTLRSQYLAWEMYAKSGSLELVPGDDDEDDDDDDSELDGEAEDTTDGRRRPVIGSYSNRRIPLRIWELEGEYVRIVCSCPRLEKIYVELDSILLIPEGDEACYNNTWGPICSDMRGSRWSCSPQWAEIGVIGKDGAEVGQRITVSTNMYSGFGWQRHTYVVEDESFLNRIEEGCSVILWMKADLNYPNLVCWDAHFHIRHAQIHLIPELDNLLPLQVNANFPSGLGKVETFQKLRRGRCLNWKYLSYQNPFVALKQIDVVVEAHECAPETVSGEVVSWARHWLTTRPSEVRHLFMKLVKARTRDLQEILEKLSTTLNTNKISESSGSETKKKEEEHSQSSETTESSVNGGVSRSAESDSLPQERVLDIGKAAFIRILSLLHRVRAIEGPLRWEDLHPLINMQEGEPVSDRQEYQIRSKCYAYISDILRCVNLLGKHLSWEEISLLMDEKEGRQGDSSVEFEKETGRGSTWGELSILTPEGDQVGERLVVFTNTPYHRSTPVRKHHYIVDEHNHHTFLNRIKRGYRVVLWLRSGPGWSTAENSTPAAHYAKYASIELIPKL